MVYNTSFSMYPYGQYGFNNPYSPQITGENSQKANGGESEKESGSKAFITNDGHGKSVGSTNSNLALSAGIGACVAALGVIFARHILKPRDISKFVGESKNITKITEEVKAVIPEVEKTTETVKTVVPEIETTVPKIENVAPEVKTGVSNVMEDVTKKQTFESEKEMASLETPKVKTLQKTFTDTNKKIESVLNKVSIAEDIKKGTTTTNKKGFIGKIKDGINKLFSSSTKIIENKIVEQIPTIETKKVLSLDEICKLNPQKVITLEELNRQKAGKILSLEELNRQKAEKLIFLDEINKPSKSLITLEESKKFIPKNPLYKGENYIEKNINKTQTNSTEKNNLLTKIKNKIVNYFK